VTLEEMKQGLDAIKSIAKSLAEIVVIMRAQKAAPGEEVASDAELDGNYGDPLIKKDPRDWHGQSYVNKHFSDAPAEYLDMLASFCAWKAGKNEEDATDANKPATEREKAKKYARYARGDAARARGWALRKRNGWEPRKPAEEDSHDFGGGAADDFGGAGDGFGAVGSSDEIPF
jgi:hypothetical protein